MMGIWPTLTSDSEANKLVLYWIEQWKIWGENHKYLLKDCDDITELLLILCMYVVD